MHAMEATIGDDSRMALAAGGLESMPIGENADGVTDKSVSTVRAGGNALVMSCCESVVRWPGMRAARERGMWIVSLTRAPPRDACAQVVFGRTLDEKQFDCEGDVHDEVHRKVSCGRDGKVEPMS